MSKHIISRGKQHQNIRKTIMYSDNLSTNVVLTITSNTKINFFKNKSSLQKYLC